jgi:predicted RNA-binding protein with PIN domain
VRLGSRRRGAGPRAAGIRELTAALDRLLRPALEAAVAVARVGEEATPAIPAPPPLRPFLQFAKLPARAVGAARRAVESDEEFRSRVAEVVAEDDVGRAGWLWLTRPPGWEDDLEDLRREATDAGEAAADRRAENEARRRLAGAEAATQRAEAAAAAAQAEAARAAAALADERRGRRAAAREAEDLAGRLRQAGDERDRARADRDRAREEATRARQRTADLKAELDDVRLRPPEPSPQQQPAPAPAPAAVPGPRGDEHVRAAAGALLGAAAAAADLAASLRSAAAALGADTPSAGAAPTRSGRPSAPPAEPPAPPPVPPLPAQPSPARATPARPPRRVPAPLPPGILDDSVEAADHLLRVPGISVLVDGYNVSQTGWPDLAIAEQRRRLVDALTELVARTGAGVSVVFDGADPLWPPVVPATSRLVKVSFSPPEVEADDVVLARVADLDPARPVLVASSDRRVRDGAAAMGANVISSPQLLAALRR